MTSYVILQIMGTLLLIIWIFALIEQLRKKGLESEVFILLIISIFLLFIVAIPDYFRNFLEKIGFIRPLDAFLVIASISSMLLVAKIYLKQNELNKNMTRIVQEIAIKDLDDQMKVKK